MFLKIINHILFLGLKNQKIEFLVVWKYMKEIHIKNLFL